MVLKARVTDLHTVGHMVPRADFHTYKFEEQNLCFRHSVENSAGRSLIHFFSRFQPKGIDKRYGARYYLTLTSPLEHWTHRAPHAFVFRDMPQRALDEKNVVTFVSARLRRDALTRTHVLTLRLFPHDQDAAALERKERSAWLARQRPKPLEHFDYRAEVTEAEAERRVLELTSILSTNRSWEWWNLGFPTP